MKYINIQNISNIKIPKLLNLQELKNLYIIQNRKVVMVVFSFFFVLKCSRTFQMFIYSVYFVFRILEFCIFPTLALHWLQKV